MSKELETIIVDIGIEKDNVVMNIDPCLGAIVMTKKNAITLAEIILDYANEIPDPVSKAD